MKVLSLALCLLLLTGCASTVAKLEQVEETVETKLEAAEEAVEIKTEPAPAPALLTDEDAAAIALKHAGLTAEQAGEIRVTYEIDDGVPEYEVEFRVDRTEYEYTVHAETGEILSFDMDN